jgi:hypothetical protein
MAWGHLQKCWGRDIIPKFRVKAHTPLLNEKQGGFQ